MYSVPRYDDVSVVLPDAYRPPQDLINKLVILNNDLFPWVSWGYLSGDYPAGISTLEGVPTSARITILARSHGMSWDAMPVKRVESGEDGIWRAEGIDPGFRYRIVGDKDGYNSVIADNVKPMNNPRFHPDKYDVIIGKDLLFAPFIVGGYGDVTITHIGGQLPQGVSFTDGSFVSEGPSGAVGAYELQFNLEDEALSSEQSQITLNLILEPLQLSAIPYAPTAFKLGADLQPFSFEASGGEGPYTYSLSGNVPVGISIGSVSGILEGIPTVEGDYTFTITVTDVRANEQTISITSTVSAAAAKYFRILVLESNTAENHGSMVELEFRATHGGKTQTFGGSPIASSYFSELYMPYLAFDGKVVTYGNENDRWAGLGVSRGDPAPWLGYEFYGHAVVEQVMIVASVVQPMETPKNFKIQSSDDGVIWADEWEVSGSTGWAPNEQRTFDRP